MGLGFLRMSEYLSQMTQVVPNPSWGTNYLNVPILWQKTVNLRKERANVTRRLPRENKPMCAEHLN